MELTNNYTAQQKNEKDIADMMGISRQQLQNYKKLTEVIPELEELVDTGIATPTAALAYEIKEEVMKWMLDIQLCRRNLSPIQRIAVVEKYRPLYEKEAKENQGTRNDLKITLRKIYRKVQRKRT